MRAEVSVVSCGDYSCESVRRALEEVLLPIDGLDFVKPGMKIAIKANLVTHKHPDGAATTHPALIGALCDMLLERGASVVIGDSPGGTFNTAKLNAVYAATGMAELERDGVKLNRNVAQSTAHFPQAYSAHEFEYTSYLDEADAIINFSKLKTHGMMGMSCAVKNMFGVVPGTRKPEYHYRFSKPMQFAHMIIDLNEYFKPSLCVVDAIVGMEGNGPTAGTPRRIGAVLASKSPYKLDLVCAKLIGLGADDVLTLKAALERGFIPMSGSVNDVGVYGDIEPFIIDDYEKIPLQKLDFSDRFLILNGFVRRSLRPRPKANESECTGCGKCERICPAHAVTLRNGKAHVDTSICIRCFCCQEFCPKGAMKVARPMLARILNK